jgi:hypothetical protein
LPAETFSRLPISPLSMCPSRCLPVYRRSVSTTKIKKKMRTRKPRSFSEMQLYGLKVFSTCSFIDLQPYRQRAYG